MTEKELLMEKALIEAKKAALSGEIPVGALIIKDGEIIASGRNKREKSHNPVLHAEIDAIIKASAKLGTWRLAGCTIYITLEPCPMCAGAIINSRIDNVVFGAYDEKGGAAGSVCNLFEMPFNHKVNVVGGVLEGKCAEQLSKFFDTKR